MRHRWGWLIVLCVGMAWAQEKVAVSLAFEVASIRQTKPGELNGYIKAMPGGQVYVARNIPVKLMISLMYKVPMRQILGGPDWMASENYDVEAKADKSYSLDDLHLMYQTLLAERFGLKFRKEVREGPVYALSIDKAGLKMKANESEQNFDIPITFAGNGVVGKRVPMRYLSWWLGQQLQAEQRPVVDETGLTKNYDFTLTFAPVRPPGVPEDTASDRPSLFDALREQLGLRLQAQKGPVEYYVIEHIERPTAN